MDTVAIKVPLENDQSCLAQTYLPGASVFIVSKICFVTMTFSVLFFQCFEWMNVSRTVCSHSEFKSSFHNTSNSTCKLKS